MMASTLLTPLLLAGGGIQAAPDQCQEAGALPEEAAAGCAAST